MTKGLRPPADRGHPGSAARRWLPLPLWLVLAAALGACGDYSGGSSGGSVGTVLPGGTSVLPPTPVSGGDPGSSLAEQVAAFSQTVYPLLQQNCVSCHAGAGPGTPAIAHPDPTTAYRAVVDNGKVNLSAPDRSRLVRRLVADFHYCWSNCVQDGATMLAAVEAWAALLGPAPGPTTNVEGLVSANLTLADGFEDEGQERYSGSQIAFFEFKEGSGQIAYDTSGVEPAMDLELQGMTEWMSNYGITFIEGKAAASRDASRKLYDRIANVDTGSQQYSIEAWVIPANVTQEGPARIVSYSAGTGSRNFTLGQILYTYDYRNRALAAELSDNGTPSLQTDDGDQDLQATLQHVVATYDQYQGRRIYVNGVFTDDEDPMDPGRLWGWNPDHTFLLGNETSNNRPWQGKIQLVAIYDQALSEEQILQNFQAGVGKRLLMRFDVSQWAGAGSYVQFVVSELDEYSYLFCEPTLVTTSPTGFRVANLRVIVNGQIAVSGQAFVNVDAIVTQSPQQLSRQCSIISKDGGPDVDVFTIAFEVLAGFEDPVIEPPPPLPPAKQFGDPLPLEGVRSFERVSETMAELTGVDPNMSGVGDTFDELRQQLPSTFDLRSFSSSQQVAISKLALDYCDAMVESNVLRNAFFGTNPAFPFDSPASSVFADPAQRDLLIDRLVDGMLGSNLAQQPLRDDVAPVLHGLLDDLTLGCDPTSCGADRTRTVVKAACAAVLASGAVSIH